MITPASPLPEAFWRPATPTASPAAAYAITNPPLADELGLGATFFEMPETLEVLAGNRPFAPFSPVALAYSGHQFGHWNPTMGDGRAHLIATLPQGLEIQLKGSGPTRFSRNGDGRAALGPMLREFLVSEAFHGLGIPTTRSLAVVKTGESVFRRRAEPGAVLARVAKSHVRVGTFQFAAAHLGKEGVATLFEHERARSHPEVQTPLAFLRSIISAQAQLIAQWMCVGFIHGVMNTDNMALSGETIDFGPCAFMDVFHPKKVFSSIDEYGRYAWDNQPAIALWNLTRLAESLLSLLDDDAEKAVEQAKGELALFYPAFEKAFEKGMLAKCGIAQAGPEDGAFIADLLRILMDEHQDFTAFFSALTRGESKSEKAGTLIDQRLSGTTPDRDLMARSNPVYIARNHQVELALNEAEVGNMERFKHLHNLLKTPFQRQDDGLAFEQPPLPTQEVLQTFCGT